MKTLKTINTAFAVALLVSAVSASAMMETVKAPFVWVAGKAVAAKDYVAATSVVQNYLKPAKTYVIGDNVADADHGVRVIKPAYDLFVRTYGRYTAAALVAAAGLGYAYNYYSAEEPKEDAAGNEPVQNTQPVETPVVAPVEPTTPVVAPVAKSADKKAKPVKSRVAGRNKKAKATNKVKRNAPAKRNVSANRKAKAKAGCANGKCGVRRSK